MTETSTGAGPGRPLWSTSEGRLQTWRQGRSNPQPQDRLLHGPPGNPLRVRETDYQTPTLGGSRSGPPAFLLRSSFSVRPVEPVCTTVGPYGRVARFGGCEWTFTSTTTSGPAPGRPRPCVTPRQRRRGAAGGGPATGRGFRRSRICRSLRFAFGTERAAREGGPEAGGPSGRGGGPPGQGRTKGTAHERRRDNGPRSCAYIRVLGASHASQGALWTRDVSAQTRVAPVCAQGPVAEAFRAPSFRPGGPSRVSRGPAESFGWRRVERRLCSPPTEGRGGDPGACGGRPRVTEDPPPIKDRGGHRT